MPTIVDNEALQAPGGVPPADPTPVQPPQDVEPIEPAPVAAQPTEPVGTVTVLSDRQAQERTTDNVAELQRIQQGIQSAQQEAARIQEGINRLGQQPAAVPPTTTPTAQPVATRVATEGTFRNPKTGQLVTFSDVDINADNIIDQGLEHISGANVSQQVRQAIADRRGIPSLAEVVSPETEALRGINTQIDDLFDPQIAAYDQFRQTLSTANRALVDSITNSFNVRREQMKTANANALNTQKILGIRSGRQRFAPEIQTGLLAAEERAGIQRLVQLDTEEKQLIAEAERAAAAEDFALLNERMNLFREKEREKLEILEEQRALALEREEAAREAVERSNREAAIVGLISQDITNPAEIFDLVNFDEEGNRVGDISLEEIQESLKVFEPQVKEQQQISELALTAREFGAPDDVLRAMQEARSFDEAVIAGGDFLRDPRIQLQIQNQKLSNALKQEQIRTAREKRVSTPENQVPEYEKDTQAALQVQDTINLINDIKTSAGLSGAVGPTKIARVAPIQALTGEKADFIGKVERLVSKEFLDTLINAKQQGATFGALTEREGQAIRTAGSTIANAAIINDNNQTVGYKMSEDAFKKELNRILSVAKRDLDDVKSGIYTQNERAAVDAVKKTQEDTSGDDLEFFR